MISTPVILCALAVCVQGGIVPSVPRFIPGEDRIVGGLPITIAEAPYQVSFQRLNKHMCGGSIISDRHILTAGHCSEIDSITRNLAVGVGSANLRSVLKYKVIRNEYHKLYNSDSVDFDVAVLKLARALSTSTSVAVIPLVGSAEEPVEGDVVTASGWGSTKSGGLTTDRLMAVSVKVVERNACKSAYQQFNPVTSRMICAGNLVSGGKDSCQGDSGGPLVSKDSGKQVGIVSWGYGCAKPHYPGVYTNIANEDINSFISTQLER